MSVFNKSQNRFASCVQQAAVVALVATLQAGCGQFKLADKEIPVDQATATDQQPEKTNSVTVASDVEAESPAAGQNKIPGAGASPTVICGKFVRFLNEDNQQNVELLLTPAALRVMTRAKFQIPAIGEPNSRFTLSEPQYSTNKQKLCYVDCKLSTRVDDKQPPTEVTWMLRRQKLGWRVGGMMVADELTGAFDLLSFECVNDVLRIKNDLSEEVTTRQSDRAIIGQSTARQP